MSHIPSSANANGVVSPMFHEAELIEALRLVDKSREVNHFEPIGMDHVHKAFQESMWRLMDDLIEDKLHVTEARDYLYRARMMLDARIQTVKEEGYKERWKRH